MKAPSAEMAAAIDVIVSKFTGPRRDGEDALAPVLRELHATALARAHALRAAAAALRDTYAEGWTAADAYRRTANGSAAATIGALYRWEQPDADAVRDLIDRLEHEAQIHTRLLRPSPGKRGPKRDDLLRLLVKEVALVCRSHGLRFTDHPTGRGAAVLRQVFARVGWAPHLSGEGLRPYLRHARDVQRRGGTSVLAWPPTPK